MTNATFGNGSRNDRWQDWANLVLSVWFFFSPWILEFGNRVSTGGPAGAQAVETVNNAAWNAWVLAAIVFVVSLSAVWRFNFWQDRIHIVLGAWIFVAPWVLGFAQGHFRAASWDHWIVGALIFVISASNQAGPGHGTADASMTNRGMPFRR